MNPDVVIQELKRVIVDQEVELKATREEAQRWFRAYVELGKKLEVNNEKDK